MAHAPSGRTPNHALESGSFKSKIRGAFRPREGHIGLVRTTGDLFDDEPRDVPLAPGAMLLGGFARPFEGPLVAAVQQVAERAPFRTMVTRGGHRMSVAMTNCGTAGWVTDRAGYRYEALDPESGRPWPPMPEAFGDLARQAAARAGFDGFVPDACLINRYEPGARMSLHQDKDERDFDAPIVSVSLGLPAVFLFGGARRTDAPLRVPLAHGDVVVWGAVSRLRYHGVLPLKDGHHPLLGRCRINLTLRLAT
jgi:alkylated DNA repair protein (DNA oxidative demethylase)